MRLFVALRPPPRVLDELDDALDAARSVAGPGWRWSPRAQWHLTVAFLGEVDPPAVPDLRTGLAAVADNSDGMRLSLSGSGRFARRVLWVGLGGDVAALTRLAADVAHAAAAAGIAPPGIAPPGIAPPGIAPPGPGFRAHLTVARAAAAGADPSPAVAALAGFTGRAWYPDRLRLVRSRLGQGPGRRALHTDLASWPLA